MLRLLKPLATLIATLLLLLLIALTALLLLVDPNDYRDTIAAEVSHATGRPFTIDGELAWSLLPSIGVRISDVTLGSPPPFSDRPLLRAGTLQLQVALLPLLSGELQMGQLRLSDADLQLQRHADGRSNWDDLLPSATAPTTTAAAPPSAPHGAIVLPNFSVGELLIERVQLQLDDALTAQRLSLRLTQLKSGAIAPQRPFPLQLAMAARVEQAAAPPLDAELQIESQLQIDPQQLRLITLNATLSQQQPEREALRLTLNSSGTLRFDRPALQLQPLQIKLPGVQLDGDLQFTTAESGAPRLNLHLRGDQLEPRLLIAALGITLPPTRDPTALTSAAIDLALTAAPDLLHLSQLRIQLDESELTGSATISEFAAPHIIHQIAIDQINLDRYLPATDSSASTADATDTTPAAPPTAATTPPAPLFSEPLLTALRQLDIDGRITIEQLQVANLKLASIRLPLRASAGHFQLQPLQAALYQGRYQGDLHLDVTTSQPHLNSRDQLTAVAAKPLLTDLLGSAPISGRVNLESHLDSRGTTLPELIQALNGELTFRFEDGALEGIDPVQLLRSGWAQLEGKPTPAPLPEGRQLTELSGSLQLRDGIAYNSDLSGKSPLLRLRGRGEVDLPQQQINYTLETVIVASLEGQGGADVANLNGITVPVTLSGALAAPAINVDSKALLRATLDAEKAKQEAQLQRKLRAAEERARQDLEQRLDQQLQQQRQELQQQLRGLFR